MLSLDNNSSSTTTTTTAASWLHHNQHHQIPLLHCTTDYAVAVVDENIDQLSPPKPPLSQRVSAPSQRVSAAPTQRDNQSQTSLQYLGEEPHHQVDTISNPVVVKPKRKRVTFDEGSLVNSKKNKGSSSLRRRKRPIADINAKVSPVAVELCRDKLAAVSTFVLQLPSHSASSVMLGSALTPIDEISSSKTVPNASSAGKLSYSSKML